MAKLQHTHREYYARLKNKLRTPGINMDRFQKCTDRVKEKNAE